MMRVACNDYVFVCVLYVYPRLHVAGETCSASPLIAPGAWSCAASPLRGCWIWLPQHCSPSLIHGCVALVPELPWARATQTQGRESPWGLQGMHVPSPSLTYISLIWIFLHQIKCRVLVCPLWVRQTCPNMNLAQQISFCCANTWLFSTSALASIVSASSKYSSDSSRNQVQGKTALPCRKEQRTLLALH